MHLMRTNGQAEQFYSNLEAGAVNERRPYPHIQPVHRGRQRAWVLQIWGVSEKRGTLLGPYYRGILIHMGVFIRGAPFSRILPISHGVSAEALLPHASHGATPPGQRAQGRALGSLKPVHAKVGEPSSLGCSPLY